MTTPERLPVGTDGPPRGADGGSGLPGRFVIIGLAIGLVVGALLGFLAGASRTRSYEATTIASVLPDNALTANQLNGSGASQVTSDFIQGELVVITSQDVRAAVQRQLHLGQLPNVTASQSGTTDIVDITAQASSPTGATAIANATRNVYAQGRVAQLAQDITTAESQVKRQIAAVQAQISATPGASTNSNGALQQEYARLLAVSSQLALDSSQSTRAVTPIQQATVSNGGLSKTTTYSLGGAVLGILAGAAALVLLRRFRPKVYDSAGLRGLGAEVLLPEFPTRNRKSRSAARVLASRLAGPPSQAARAVVLVRTRRAGQATNLATALAATYAHTAHVLLVPRPGDAESMSRNLPGAELLGADALGQRRVSRSRLLGLQSPATRSKILILDASESELRRLVDAGLMETLSEANWRLVADMPSLDTSDLAALLASRAGSATVVVAQRRTPLADVTSTIDLLRGVGVHTVNAVLAGTPLLRPGLVRRHATSARQQPAAKEAAPAVTNAAVASDATDRPVASESGPAPTLADRQALPHDEPEGTHAESLIDAPAERPENGNVRTVRSQDSDGGPRDSARQTSHGEVGSHVPDDHP